MQIKYGAILEPNSSELSEFLDAVLTAEIKTTFATYRMSPSEKEKIVKICCDYYSGKEYNEIGFYAMLLWKFIYKGFRFVTILYSRITSMRKEYFFYVDKKTYLNSEWDAHRPSKRMINRYLSNGWTTPSIANNTLLSEDF